MAVTRRGDRLEGVTDAVSRGKEGLSLSVHHAKGRRCVLPAVKLFSDLLVIARDQLSQAGIGPASTSSATAPSATAEAAKLAELNRIIGELRKLRLRIGRPWTVWTSAREPARQSSTGPRAAWLG